MNIENQSTQRVAVYPGTFDPITNGHIDLLKRSLLFFDRVIIAVAENLRKQPLFSATERSYLIKEVVGDHPKIEVDIFSGLLMDYVRKRNVRCVIRGLRALADFEYEFQLAHINRRIAPEIESIFMMTAEENFYVSSSMVKEVAYFGGDISSLVPQNVALALRNKSEVGTSKKGIDFTKTPEI